MSQGKEVLCINSLRANLQNPDRNQVQLLRIGKCFDLSSPNMVAAPSGIGVVVLLKSC